MPPPPTGETSLSAATPIASGAVAALAVVLGGILATAAVAHYRVGLGEKHADIQDLRLDAGEARSADMEARMRLQEAEGRRREEWEKRLESKVDLLKDMLLERGTRPAGGHGR
jgi:hypothetical protein